jgi:hypothetical protein
MRVPFWVSHVTFLTASVMKSRFSLSPGLLHSIEGLAERNYGNADEALRGAPSLDALPASQIGAQLLSSESEMLNAART